MAELIENEDEAIGSNSSTKSRSGVTTIGSSKIQQAQKHMLDYMPRIRMPPPGFGPINSSSTPGDGGNIVGGGGDSIGFGLNSSSAIMNGIHNGGSKILPFINLNATNYTGTTATTSVTTATTNSLSVSHQHHQSAQQHTQHQQQQQHQQLPSSIWNSHFGLQPSNTPVQQFGTADLQYRQVAVAANNLGQTQTQSRSKIEILNKIGRMYELKMVFFMLVDYGGGDWTAMDPAILSYRQFPGFPQQMSAVPPQHLQGAVHSLGGPGGQTQQSVLSTAVSSTTQNQSHQNIFLQQIAPQQHFGQLGGRI